MPNQLLVSPAELAAFRVKLRGRLAAKAAPIVQHPYPWTKYIPVEPFEKQAKFLQFQSLEALYGGAGGGGKSYTLLMAALQYVDHPGYAALLLRRTFSDLSKPQALLDVAFQWLSKTDAKWHDREKTWRFPSGATLTFGYMDTDKDKYQYQGGSYQFCVARGTPILMSDFSWKPIEEIEIGDVVQTLEGPYPILRVYKLGLKPVVQISCSLGEVLVSAQHRLLSVFDGWCVPMELLSRKYLPFDNTSKGSYGKYEKSALHLEYLYQDLKPMFSPGQQNALDSVVQDYAYGKVNDHNAYAKYSDLFLANMQPEKLCVPLVLYGQSPQSKEFVASSYVHDDVFPLTLLQDFPIGYLLGLRFYGGYLQMVKANDLENILQRGGVVEQSPSYQRGDGQGNIHGYTPPRYVHPYTREHRPIHGGVMGVNSCINPMGEAEVFDLTVSSASHYIIFPGLISSNCGWDELTQFLESQYTFLFGWLRGTANSDVPLRMRAASNPGNIGHDWVKKRFIESYNPDRQFLPAKYRDNPFLNLDEYDKSLEELDPITRQQIKEGDWSARHGGNKFRREWFEIVSIAPTNCQKVRFWDMAATEAKPGKDPDWTVGGLLGLTKNRTIFILDIKRMRGTPGQVEALVKQTAELDGRDMPVRMEQEPGASGVKAIDDYRRRVLMGWDFKGIPSTGSKEVRANPLASQAEAGNVKLVSGAWNNAFLDEAELFPVGSHDDQVDAVSGALSQLSSSWIETEIRGEAKSSKWREGNGNKYID